MNIIKVVTGDWLIVIKVVIGVWVNVAERTALSVHVPLIKHLVGIGFLLSGL